METTTGVACKVTCNDLKDGATVYVGKCTSHPEWKVVRFVRYVK